MQDLILSLAGPPRKYQKDLPSFINTMFCSLKNGAKERSEREEKQRAIMEALNRFYCFLFLNLSG
jgi:hypothetical protein